MIPGRTKRSIGTFEPKTVTVPPGSTGGWGFVPIPKASDTEAWATSSNPSEAASLASGAAVRSGRKTANSTPIPRTSSTRNVITSAGAVATCTPYVPVFSDQYV